MSNNDVPIWEKYTLTIEEASKYFRIGENKLRRLAEENPTAGWVILNGNRIQIKRKQFEKSLIPLTQYSEKGLARVIIGYKRVKALSVMERSMTKCQEKNEMKKTGQQRPPFEVWREPAIRWKIRLQIH